jgi:hypothetical protein
MRTGQHVAELACTMRQKGARIDAPCPVVTGNRHRQHVAGGTGQADAWHRLHLPGAPRAQYHRKAGLAPLIRRRPPTLVAAGPDVVDDFPTAIPVTRGELEVIETYLGALLDGALGKRE